MLKLFPLMLILVAAVPVQASVFGDHYRGSNSAATLPERISVGRFSDAVVDNTRCDWEHAGSFELKTDRGNYDITSYRVAPNAIKVTCAGRQPFYIFNLPERYLSRRAGDGDVGVWYGSYKERYGCEGYPGCDQVHVLEVYHPQQVSGEKAAELRGW